MTHITKAQHLWRVLRNSAGLLKTVLERPTRSAQLKKKNQNWNVHSTLLNTTPLIVVNSENDSFQQ